MATMEMIKIIVVTKGIKVETAEKANKS